MRARIVWFFLLQEQRDWPGQAVYHIGHVNMGHLCDFAKAQIPYLQNKDDNNAPLTGLGKGLSCCMNHSWVFF